MTETAERIIQNHFGCSADKIEKIQSAVNNFVYAFTVAGNDYFLKMYRSKDWPEEGKVPFVYRCLSENSIPLAGLVAYSREDELYPNGYRSASLLRSWCFTPGHWESVRPGSAAQ